MMDRDSALRKAHKAFQLAGNNPTTPEEREAYRLGVELLTKLAKEEAKGAPLPLPPAPLKADKRPFWNFKDRITAVPWKEFFQTEVQNKMVTFRITPHTKVTNNNRRLWRAIYQMYALYEKRGKRRQRVGWKFQWREQDTLWYDIVFKQENDVRTVAFYVTTSEFQATKLKRKIENKMDVTIAEVDSSELHVPKENTIVQELRYTHHDIFSLNTNINDTETPIASILNTVDELQFDGDMARLSFCAIPERRSHWVKSASWAYDGLRKGKIPHRPQLEGKRIVAAGQNTLRGVLNEVGNVLTEAVSAISSAFFKTDNVKKKEMIEKGFSLEDEINARRLSTTTMDKVNLPVFKVHARIAAHSEDKQTREMMADTMGLSFTELADNNEVRAYPVRIGSRRYEIIEELNTFHLSKKTRLKVNVNLVSTDEMAKLALQMPPDKVQRRYDAELNVQRRVETDVPAALRGEKGMYVGEAEVKDQVIPIRIPMNNPEEFYRAYVSIGGMGAGKDTFIQNWVVEGCLNHGISAIVPDVVMEESERGMANAIRDALPPDKVIDIDLADPDYSVPLDLTEIVTALGRDGRSRFANEVIDFFGDMDNMARSQTYLTAAAKASEGSLYNMRKIILDEDYRLERIGELQEEGDHRLADELIAWGTNDQLAGKCDPILYRLNKFFGTDKLYDIFCQAPKLEVNFAQWMREGKVVILRIPNRRFGKLAVKTLVHWIVLKVFMTRLLMSERDKANGVFLAFNEPEQFATDGLNELMGRIGTEGRKERMGSLWAFHHWNKLPHSLQENLQGGGVQQFLYANDHLKTFEISKHRLEPTVTMEEAAKLPMHYAAVSVRAGGALQHAFICHMAAPVYKRLPKYNNEFLTKRHARMYGRSWKDLQKDVG